MASEPRPSSKEPAHHQLRSDNKHSRWCHPKFQDFFEARNETELAVLETAYEDFLDRVGEKVVVSLSSGAGSLNLKIPLGPTGESYRMEDLELAAEPQPSPTPPTDETPRAESGNVIPFGRATP